MRSATLVLALAMVAPFLAGCISAGAPAASAPPVREFVLEAVETEVELYSGKTVTAWTYNGQLPGPLVRVIEGDLVRVHFYNNHTLPHTIHFHGSHPFDMDGDDADAVPPGGSFTYEFIAGPPGAYVYHCHVDTPVHIPMGLYGQFIVDPKDGWPGEPADKELFAVFSDWNPNHNATAETYLFNGKAFPYTEPLQVEQGARVRVFVSSMSDFPVAGHLHGYLPQQVWPWNHPIDVVPLAHAETRVIEFKADNPGAWMFHDHYEQHLKNDGIYPGGGLNALEVGVEHWGRFHERMGTGHGSHDHGSGHAEAPSFTEEELADAVVVEVQDYEYAQPELRVTPGTVVVWRNVGKAPHTVTSDDAAGPLDSPMLAPGEEFAFRFDAPGEYAYHCTPHSGKKSDGTWAGMVGKVVVEAPQ